MKPSTLRTIAGITVLFGLLAPAAYTGPTANDTAAGGSVDPANTNSRLAVPGDVDPGTRNGVTQLELLQQSGAPACCGVDWRVLPHGDLWSDYCAQAQQAHARHCRSSECIPANNAVMRDAPLRECALDRFMLSLTALLSLHRRSAKSPRCDQNAGPCDVGPDAPVTPRLQPVPPKPVQAKPTEPKPIPPRPTPPKPVQRRQPVVPNPVQPRQVQSGVPQPGPVPSNQIRVRRVPTEVPRVDVAPRREFTTTPDPAPRAPASTEPVLLNPSDNNSLSADPSVKLSSPRDDAPVPPNSLQHRRQPAAVPTNVIPKRVLQQKSPKKTDRQVSYRLSDFISTR